MLYLANEGKRKDNYQDCKRLAEVIVSGKTIREMGNGQEKSREDTQKSLWGDRGDGKDRNDSQGEVRVGLLDHGTQVLSVNEKTAGETNAVKNTQQALAYQSLPPGTESRLDRNPAIPNQIGTKSKKSTV